MRTNIKVIRKITIGIQGLITCGLLILVAIVAGSAVIAFLFAFALIFQIFFSFRAIAEFDSKNFFLYRLFRDTKIYVWRDLESLSSSPHSSSTFLKFKDGSVVFLSGMLHKSYHDRVGEIVDILEKNKIGNVIDEDTRKILARGTYLRRVKRLLHFGGERQKHDPKILVIIIVSMLNGAILYADAGISSNKKSTLKYDRVQNQQLHEKMLAKRNAGKNEVLADMKTQLEALGRGSADNLASVDLSYWKAHRKEALRAFRADQRYAILDFYRNLERYDAMAKLGVTSSTAKVKAAGKVDAAKLKRELEGRLKGAEVDLEEIKQDEPKP